MKEKLKILIIGAGIIGLYLALKLNKLGQKVVIFEQKNKIGGKVCSALVSERIKEFLPLSEKFILNKVDSCLIHFPKKTVKIIFKPKHFVIERDKLENYLFQLAKNSGIEIFFNKRFDEMPLGFDKIIGCDGALSKIREKAFLSQSFKLGILVSFPIKDFSNYVETWPIKNGFLWKIPKGQETEYGALGEPKSILKEFKKFLKEKNLYLRDFENKIKSALVPQKLVLAKLDNITLAGDAAGFIKPWSGGGIIWSLKAADVLIEHFPDFLEYKKAALTFFGPKILKGRMITNLVYFLGKNFPYLLPKKVRRDNNFPLI